MSRRTWSSLAQLQLETARYQHGWWSVDTQVADRANANAALAATLASRPPLVTTLDVYRELDGTWPARADLHARLAAAQLATGAASAPALAFFTIGCVGAGKTTVLRPLVHAYRSVVHGRGPASLSRIAADEVRESLPEYADGLGSAVVQAEAFAITYGPLFHDARASQLDMVYDTIGTEARPGATGFADAIRQLKADGYQVHVLLVQTPLHLCLTRAEQRALTSDGRLVEPEFLHFVYEQPQRALERLRAEPGLLDGWVIVDGSGSATAPPMTDASDRWQKIYPQLLDALGPGTTS